MLIEQEPEEVKRSFQFQMNAQITAIRLMDALVRRDPGTSMEDIGEYLTTTISFKIADYKRSKETVTFGVKFRFKILAGEDKEPRELAVINCHFDADYELRDGFEPEESHINAFHNGNAIFNCWPYFRELVQSATVRMGLPPPAIPFLRLIPKITPRTIDAKAQPVGEVAAQKSEQARARRGRKKITI